MKRETLHAIAMAATAARAAGERARFEYTATAADFPAVRDAITLALRRGQNEILFAPRDDGAVVERLIWRCRNGAEIVLTWVNQTAQKPPGIGAGAAALADALGHPVAPPADDITRARALRTAKTKTPDELRAELGVIPNACPKCGVPLNQHDRAALDACAGA